MLSKVNLYRVVKNRPHGSSRNSLVLEAETVDKAVEKFLEEAYVNDIELLRADMLEATNDEDCRMYDDPKSGGCLPGFRGHSLTENAFSTFWIERLNEPLWHIQVNQISFL